jgi:transitional endoplasmic reticulum ATPase
MGNHSFFHYKEVIIINSIKNLQLSAIDFVNKANKFFEIGKNIDARIMYLCAAEMNLRIGKYSDREVGESFLKKTRELIEKASRIPMSDIELKLDLNQKIKTTAYKNENNNEKKVTQKENFSSVAGLKDVKEIIFKQVINPLKYENIYKKYEKRNGGGILLYGLPGNGKTLIAKAIANEINAKFFEIKTSDILSKWLGDSENNISKLFEEANKYKNSILFFDEFDALGRSRNEVDETVSRVIAELLVHIDGYSRNKSNIMIICATNRPQDIDPAFLRPGRLSKRIYVPMPDEEARLTIIKNSLKNIPLSDDFNFERVVNITEGYSGADTFEFCDYLKLFAIEREILSNQPSQILNNDISLTEKAIKPSFTIEEVNAYEAMFSARKRA